MLHLIVLDAHTPHVYLSFNIILYYVFNYDTKNYCGADISCE